MKRTRVMSVATFNAALLSAIFTTLSGCSLVMTKNTQYQLPDYYETRHITTEPVAGKAYYVNNLRCKDTPSIYCNQQEEVVQHGHRDYKKPYYLSK